MVKMAPSNHESTVQSLLTRANYRNAASAKRDILNALTHYRGLVPKLEKFIFNDGRARDLICLRGTIPVTYRNASYNIPVGFWILVIFCFLLTIFSFLISQLLNKFYWNNMVTPDW